MERREGGLIEHEVRVTAVPVTYLGAIRLASILMVLAMLVVLVGTILTFSTVRKTQNAQQQSLENHRVNDRQHICFAGLDHLRTDLDLEEIKKALGIKDGEHQDPSEPDGLRPEEKEICVLVQEQSVP